MRESESERGSGGPEEEEAAEAVQKERRQRPRWGRRQGLRRWGRERTQRPFSFSSVVCLS